MSKKGSTPWDNLLAMDVSRKEFLGLGALAVASLFGISGILREVLSHASTATVSVEPEKGSVTGGTASTVTDATASAGGAVKFAPPVVSGGGAADGTTAPWPTTSVISPYITKQYTDYPVVEYAALQKANPGATFQEIMNSHFPSQKSYLHLPAGNYTMVNFPAAGGFYSIYSPNCMGIWGDGRDKTVMTQLATGGGSGRAAVTLGQTSGQSAVMRLGPGNNTAPIHNFGWTLTAEDQISSSGALQLFNGYQIYRSIGETWENISLKGANYASGNSPPEETNNVGSYYGSNIYFHDVEVDGRNASGYRGGASGMNSVTTLHYKNCYFHHSNVSGVTFSTVGEAGQLSTNILTEDCTVYYNADHVSGSGKAFSGFNHERVGGYIQHIRPKITFDLAGGHPQAHFTFGTLASYGAAGSAKILIQDANIVNGPGDFSGTATNLGKGMLVVAIPVNYAGTVNAQKTSDLTVKKTVNGQLVTLAPVARGKTGDPNKNFMLLTELI